MLRNNLKTENPDLGENELNAQVGRMLQDADARTIDVLRRRMETLGIKKPVMQTDGHHDFTIQLSDLTEGIRELVEDVIRHQGVLEFKLVHAQNDELVDTLLTSGRLPEGYALSDDGRGFVRIPDWTDFLKDPDYHHRLSLFEVPDPSYTFMLDRKQNASGQIVYRAVFVNRKAELTGAAVARATVERDRRSDDTHIALSFDAEGAKAFARLTQAYAPRGSQNSDSDEGRQLAIVMDGILYSAPVIRTEILNGQAIIAGFLPNAGTIVCAILNAGALPVPLRILER
ncbi:MAG: hypothetical protein LBW77_07515 [Verrucomicrobiota bacterium]|nr:hypothetical protein [Verrucomicrobiota bacterium]